MDGHNRKLAPLIAETALDFIESFTPAPETDLSLGEARTLWPGKALQIHFPSSVHLAGKAAVESVAEEYLRQAAPGDGLIIGVSEDLPNRGIDTMIPFFAFFTRNGELPIQTVMHDR